MKKIDRVILILFSLIILVESVMIIGVITNIYSVEGVLRILSFLIGDETAVKVTLVVSIICFICAAKCLFFGGSGKEDEDTGVLMENDNGKLLISSETIENIVSNVVKGFDSITDVAVSTDLADGNNLIINLNVIVGKDVVIKELTLNVQNKIKEAIKKTSDLEVKEVNVKITDIKVEEEEKEN